MNEIPSPPLVKIKKKTRKFSSKVTDLVARFLGSWLAVIFHGLWFSLWLILDFSIEALTFAVSLEAIFIGIFLLMSSNKAEVKRDLREYRQHQKDRRQLERDLQLDEKADRQLIELKRLQKEVHREVISLKKLLEWHHRLGVRERESEKS